MAKHIGQEKFCPGSTSPT